MDGLSPETRDLLARAEGADAMPDERRRALRLRVAGALGIAAPLAASASASPGHPAAPRWMRWERWMRWMRWGHGAPWGTAATAISAVGLAGALVVVAIATKPVVVRERQPPSVQPAPLAVATTAPAAAAVATVPLEERVPPPSVDVSPMETARVVPTSHAPRAAPRAQTAATATAPRVLAPSATSPYDVGAEAHLLSSAQAALAYGNPGQALTFLDEHDARFPTGTLALESHSLRVTALCASGRAEEARAEAARLRERFPAASAAIGAAASCASRER